MMLEVNDTMAILEILQYPNSRLHKKADLVETFDSEIKKVIDDMLETLHNTKNCAGLAATQLNIKNPKAITIIYDYSDEKDPEPPLQRPSLCLVNPVIIAREGEFSEPEGCMSVSGGIYEPVLRAEKVTVRAMNRDGEFFEIQAEGYMAKLLQHEIDHLNGLLFIDRLSRLKRQRIDKRFIKHLRWSER